MSSKAVNNVIVTGRLTRDPKVKYTKTGKTACTCSIAINDSFVAASGTRREVCVFIDAVCYGKPAEYLAENVRKGDKILIVGKLAQDSWKMPDGKPARKTVLMIGYFDQYPRREGQVDIPERQVSDDNDGFESGEPTGDTYEW